ncbi:CRISPR-associated helicase Cas3' [Ectothiorhodospiraceae bacterium BW-2]|nr:CRISPR-associated helicase Cas3' [Ectothiorhodospiraceae bacterium BW-2]
MGDCKPIRHIMALRFIFKTQVIDLIKIAYRVPDIFWGFWSDLTKDGMGEGKTELAFMSQLRLQQQFGHRGLYIALPTQATGNAMYQRTQAFIHQFDTEANIAVQLAHGGALLRLHEISGEQDDSVQSAAWFSQRKRPLLAAYGVGTIDQALFATLNVKHHFVRLWGLSNKVVVLDEVHAYDTYTSGLIVALLRWLKKLHCSVVLMSATLPTAKRQQLMSAWGANTTDQDIAYPRLWSVQSGQVEGRAIACRLQPPITIEVEGETVEALSNHALRQLQQGGCGVVIVNTVQRAQQLYGLLKTQLDSDTRLLLFHARYPFDEREQLEKKVLQWFGECGERPEQALLIATQVVEQSLDIDFDFMITDLAPIDLLLQRAGRLHRHTQNHRSVAHQSPVLTIAGIHSNRLPELTETAWGYVYDHHILYRSWSVIKANRVWHLPADIDRLVQQVYGSEVMPEEEQAEYQMVLDTALGEHYAELGQQRQHAQDVAIHADDELQNAYNQTHRASEEGEGGTKQVITREGAESMSVIPLHQTEQGWQIFAETEPFNPNDNPDEPLARALFRRQVRLSRKAIIVALKQQELYPLFANHPLLRNLYPLLLQNGVAQFGKLQVRLDNELGLIYETTDMGNTNGA